LLTKGNIIHNRGMQDCFRKHPDIYGSELEEDEVDDQLEEHIATAADENHSTPAPLSESTSASEIEASSETVKTQTGQL
jgi:intermembrane space import and assembly protein 40